MNVIDIILLVAAGLVALPIMVIAAETLAALLADKPHAAHAAKVAPSRTMNNPLSPHASSRPSVAVLMPAHNENLAIGQSVTALRLQLMEGDRLLVVADNCTDDTADIARAAGAQVLERTDATHRGKGYALAAGIAHLKSAPPDVVLIIDADMRLQEGSVAALSNAAFQQRVPMQAIDVLTPPANSSPKTQLSAFAFTFKNLVRGLGAEILHIPCALRGTGMAFPWGVIDGANLATGNIVEDMQLGIDLALTGSVPRFCRTATVTGMLPEKNAANKVQRTRWEHGHLHTILHNVPRLLWQGILKGRPELFGLALDLAVPPLALLVLAWSALTVLTGFLTFLGQASVVPLIAALASGMLLTLSILAAWAKFARHILPLFSLLSVPFYILWKVPLYLAFLLKRQRSWVRTERS